MKKGTMKGYESYNDKGRSDTGKGRGTTTPKSTGYDITGRNANVHPVSQYTNLSNAPGPRRKAGM